MKKLALVLATTPFFASAGLFSITCVNGGTTAGAGNCAAQGQQILDQIAEEVNKNLPSADSQDEYFKGMSTANSMAAAGVTTSYGTVFKKFLVGITASGGAHLGSKSASDFGDIGEDPQSMRGFGVQAAIVAGVNLGNAFNMEPGTGIIDPTKLNLYASGFALNKKIGDVDSDYMGFGASAQYRLFDERNWAGKSVKWTGLETSVGILYSKLDVNAIVPLNKTYTTTVGGNTYTGTVNSNALLNAKVSTLVMPIEISTGVRLLYVLKFVGGLGVDVSLGKTEGSGSLSNNGNVEVTDGGGNTANGTPSMTINGNEAGDILNLRAFVGPHIEFGVGSVFVNVHKSLLENAIAVNSGLNFFW